MTESISNFAVPSTGTYYAHISSTQATPYTLIVTGNAAFTAPPNNSPAMAQPLPNVPASGRAAVLGHIGPGSATVEPDDYFAGTALTNVVPGVTLTVEGDSNPVTAQVAPLSSTGTQTFGDGPDWYWWSGASLRADFATPVASVSIDLVPYYTYYQQGFLQAYDSSGHLLQDVEATAPYPGFYTMTVSSSSNDIAYILAGAQSNQYIMLDHLVASRMANDYYSVAVHAGDVLTLATTSPAGGPGEFQNTLDPAIALYDPNGTLVASDDNGGPYGQNALVNYTAAVSGQYVVEVSGAGGTSGDYVLNVAGATGSPTPFAVASTSPAAGSTVKTATTMTVAFNDGVLLTSLQPSDLTIDGLAATAVSVVNGNTVAFTLPSGLSQGSHTAAIAAGAILDLQGTPLQAYSGQLTIDTTAPRVISTTLQENASVPAGNLTEVVQFSEPMLTANLDITDFTLQGSYLGVAYAPTSFSYDPTGTTLTLNYTSLPDDRYTLTLLSADGRFEDVAGNNLDGETTTSTWPIPPHQSGNGTEGGNFVVDFWADAAASLPFPTPLTPVAPSGSLIYDPSVIGAIGPATDTDSYTINLDAGQTVTVLTDPASGLRPSLQLRNPSGTVIATASSTAANYDAVIQPVAVSVAGTYTVTIGSLASTTGKYTLQIFLNAALEAESHNGASNNTLSAAQNIDGSFISLGTGESRGAVLGSGELSVPALPTETEPNGNSSLASNAKANFTAYSGNLYQLGATGTISTVGDNDWYAIGSMDAGDVLTISMSGTDSSRGTVADTYLSLYRLDGSTPTLVASNDDGGPGLDSLIYRFTISTAGNYYVVARAFGTGTGTYALGMWLENSGPAPSTGGSVTTETEPNDNYSTATDVSTSWRAVQYLSQTAGTISTAGDLDYYAFQFTAGDVITTDAVSTSGVELRSWITSHAYEDGTSDGPGLDSPIYSYRITTTGTYDVEVAPFHDTGSYSLMVYLSTGTGAPGSFGRRGGLLFVYPGGGRSGQPRPRGAHRRSPARQPGECQWNRARHGHGRRLQSVAGHQQLLRPRGRHVLRLRDGISKQRQCNSARLVQPGRHPQRFV